MKNKNYTWWVNDCPFEKTFETLSEVYDDIRAHIEEIGNKSVIIGTDVEEFDYAGAAKECFGLMKDRFEEIYDDWQSNLDDDRVWWEEDEESQKRLLHEIEDYFLHKTDFSVKEKATPILTISNEYLKDFLTDMVKKEKSEKETQQKRREIVVRKNIYNGKDHKLVETDIKGEFEFVPAEYWMPVYFTYELGTAIDLKDYQSKRIVSFDSDGFGTPVYIGDKIGDFIVREIFFRDNKTIVKMEECSGKTES